jgi:hypothetical protein
VTDRYRKGPSGSEESGASAVSEDSK